MGGWTDGLSLIFPACLHVCAQVLILLGFELVQSVNWLAGTLLSEKLYGNVRKPRLLCSKCWNLDEYFRAVGTPTHPNADRREL